MAIYTSVRFLVTLLFGLALLPSASVLAADNRPNILFIMSDDHTTQAVGAYGSRLAPLNPTPVIDTLAREGAIFTNCFVTNSICTPSRASIMTGQYPHVNGVTDLGGGISPDHQHLAREMRNAGYHTAMIGKWHLKQEPAAFDYYQVLPGQGKYHDPEFRTQGPKDWPHNLVKYNGKHSSDAITDITLDWLRSGWDRHKPFFLMHHYKAPHDMFENAKRYNDYLADVEIPAPDSLWNPFEGEFGSIATRGHHGWSGFRASRPHCACCACSRNTRCRQPSSSRATRSKPSRKRGT